MKQSFIEYSMTVITARAAGCARRLEAGAPPHPVRDERVRHLTPNRPYKKSARTVGDVIGKYHPHGDSAVYDAMVRLAQGSPCATRWSTATATSATSTATPRQQCVTPRPAWPSPPWKCCAIFDKDTVDWQPNYDESLEEPQCLPARFPNLLVNGSQGIAVGMATNIPPHNLGEVIDATCMPDRQPGRRRRLMQHHHGPGLPHRRHHHGPQRHPRGYETGRGSITVRAKAHVENQERPQPPL